HATNLTKAIRAGQLSHDHSHPQSPRVAGDAMLNRSRAASVAALAVALSATVSVIPVCLADNPIIQTKFTADPAPLVYNDTLYLYTSHDDDNATGFTMYNWLLYSTTDMVNWTDHGIVAGVADPSKTFKWADGNNAWAPQVVPRNGKFYLYVPL